MLLGCSSESSFARFSFSSESTVPSMHMEGFRSWLFYLVTSGEVPASLFINSTDSLKQDAEYSSRYTTALFAGVRKVLDDTSMGTEFADDRL